MPITQAQMAARRAAWQEAQELVLSIIEDHGLEDYAIGPMFGPTSRFTKVDQNLDHIERTAEWLMGER